MNEILLAMKVLSSGRVQRDRGHAEEGVELLINLLGEKIPIPGVAQAATLMNIGIEKAFDHQHEKKNKNALQFVPTIKDLEEIAL